MEIVRYTVGGEGTPRVGVRLDSGGVHRLPVDLAAELWTLPLAALPAALAAHDPHAETEEVRLLPPVDGLTEVWAAGVTYEWSREARMQESQAANVYQLVYDAPRPELFFKAPAWRVSGPEDDIGVRADSPLNVPEPELAIVANAMGEVVGMTVCNDVSSRSIEGENPLYLPQAKMYAGSCAIGPGVRPIWEIADPRALSITLTVVRAGEQVWGGATTTASLHRELDQLVACLFAGQSFPYGAVLSTGTGVVPEMTFSLQAGDRVRIEIPTVGVLDNLVHEGREPFAWLDERARQVGRIST